MLFAIDLDSRDVPFLTQQPDHIASEGTMQACRAIAFRVERTGNLSIDVLSGIEFTNPLPERFHISRLFVPLHTAFLPELLILPSFPVDLKPDLSLGSLAIDDH